MNMKNVNIAVEKMIEQGALLHKDNLDTWYVKLSDVEYAQACMMYVSSVCTNAKDSINEEYRIDKEVDPSEYIKWCLTVMNAFQMQFQKD